MTDKLTTEDVLRKLNGELEAQVLEMEGDLDSALTKLNIARVQASERAKRIRELSREKEHWRKKCVDLEEQIEADDVDFMRVIHAKEVEKLQGRIDHLERVYWKHWGEREELRELCRDLYREAWMVSSDDAFYAPYREAGFKPKFKERMEQLGLLGGEQND